MAEMLFALVIGDDAIRAYSGYANILMDVGLEFSKLYEEEKVSSVDEMYNNGMKISNACYYSGINRITYYYISSTELTFSSSYNFFLKFHLLWSFHLLLI